MTAILREALVLTALLALPLLGLLTAAGLGLAILQAATQVQEQTLSLLPKIAIAGIAAAIFGAPALAACARLMRDAVAAAPALARLQP